MQHIPAVARPPGSWLAAVAVRAAVALAAVLGLTIGVPGTASADVITGAWALNHEICKVSSCVNSGNLVLFWQSILWADRRVRMRRLPWPPSFAQLEDALTAASQS